MRAMRRRLLVLCLLLLVAAPAHGAGLPLTTRLAQALQARHISPATTGAVVLDLRTGRTIFARNPDTPLEPASNEKLATTFAALEELGADYRFRTELVGRGYQDGATWRGDVFLKGLGDPTLTSLQLDRLATQLRLLGVTRIAGRVLGDESWFDSVRTGPGWKPSFFITDCPPLSALVVDRAWYDHHTALQPALAAAGRLRTLLKRHGISSGAAGLGRAPASGFVLAQVNSAPLAQVLAEMDHASDNFVAEMVTKEIGAETGAGGTTAAGTAIIRRDLAAAGVRLAGVRIVDGSGLSLDDRLTARAVTDLLQDAWTDPGLQQAFWTALPIAGVDGTLAYRMTTGPAHGVVRAKTGTTDEANALSGYVGQRYVFSILENGSPTIDAAAAQRTQNRFATALASTLP